LEFSREKILMKKNFFFFEKINKMSLRKANVATRDRRREILRVWNMLYPKPVELRRGKRRFLREGPLKQWSEKQKRVKKKYMFLFSDCLLVCRKDSKSKFWLKIFCYLSSIRDVQFVPGKAYGKTPDTELRIHTAKKTLVLFAASKIEADTWVRDLNYARGGCKGDAPPSVFHYDDDDDEYDLDRPVAPPKRRPVPQQAQGGEQAGHRDPAVDDAIRLANVEPLIDLHSEAVHVANPFGDGSASSSSSSAASAASAPFDPFGLNAPQQQQQQPQFASFDQQFFGMQQPNPFAAPAVAMSFDAQPPQQPQQAVRQAPVFLPDAALGAAHVTDQLVGYVERLPAELHNDLVLAATKAAKDAAARLTAAIDAFNASPSTVTQRQLQFAAAENADLASRLMAEATFIAESEPPDEFKRQLALAVQTTAVSVNQLVNASNIALDHYTQQEQARAEAEMEQARVEADAARAQAEQAGAAAAEQADKDALAALERTLEAIAKSISGAGEKLAAAAESAAASSSDAAGGASQVPSNAGAIVSGTSDVTSLTAELLRIATQAQREVWAASGAAADSQARRYHNDPAWQQGLISAAQAVGANIELLLGAATELTQTNSGRPEMLVAALRQVNGANARLVAAARAKMAADSEMLPKLDGAVASVRKASKELAQAANETARRPDDDDDDDDDDQAPAGGAATQVGAHLERMETLAEVARLERQLEEARKRVATITKAQYTTTE
jgi:I/LWEQ domain/PH domain